MDEKKSHPTAFQSHSAEMMKILIPAILVFLLPLLSGADLTMADYLKIVRERKPGHSPGSVSEDTIGAAGRVFSTLSFLHKTRTEIDALMGPPTESNTAEGTVTYRYDNGFGGWAYRLWFRSEAVYKIEAIGID